MSDDEKTQQDAFERLERNMRDEEAWRAAGCPPGLITGMATPLPPGEHVVHVTIDTATPIAPENIFLPTENPDGTWTTKVPVGHPEAGVFWRSSEEPAPIDSLARATTAVRTILMGFPAFQRVDIMRATGLCRDCGDDVGDYRCQCTNDE